MNYEKRVIIYLDFLGFKERIYLTEKTAIKKDEKINTIFNVFSFLKKIIGPESNPHSITKNKVITHFSDLIVMSFPTSDHESLVDEIRDTQIFLGNCLLNGFFVRGSIIYGEIVHTPEIIFGPGLIEAYESEKSQAKFPRVIIDEAIILDAKENKSPFGDIESVTSMDSDGIYFIDYFEKIRSNLDDDEQYRKYLQKMTSLLFDMSRKSSLMEKLEWAFPKYYRMLVDIKFLHEDRLINLGLEDLEEISWIMKTEWK